MDNKNTSNAVSLYIPFSKIPYSGGPKTFLRNLASYTSKKGIFIEREYSKGSHIFFPIEYPLGELKKIKALGGKVIQRLDGVHYYKRNGLKFLWYNKKIYPIYWWLADHIIFQSDYSKRQCFHLMGKKKDTEFDIVCNGVDTKVFFPDRERKPQKKWSFISTGIFRHEDMIVPVVKALDMLREKVDFSYHLVGPIRKPSLASWFQRDYIVHHGEKDFLEIAQLLRKSDAFIFSALNPQCPNALLEAVASGLPVVGFDSGATKELCHFAPELFAYVSDHVIQSPKDFIAERLAQKVTLLIENYEKYRSISLSHWQDYDLETMGDHYFKVFDKVLGKFNK